MSTEPVQVETKDALATVALDDPDRRNALGFAMFDALDEALRGIGASERINVVLLHGRGSSFCAGFDLSAAADDPAVMATFIERLSGLLETLRRLPQVVVGAVHGAAIAGGCAIVSACDLVVVSATAKLGYPVHRLGVSPAVSLPTLEPAVGSGAARALFVGGQLVDGRAALRMGLAHVVSPCDESVLAEATALAKIIAGHGPNALRVTKAWLNELENALDDERFDGPMRDTAALARTEEAQAYLKKHL